MKEYSAEAKRFYSTKAWKACRASYISYRIKLDGGMCETCHQSPGYIVHHKISIDARNINNPEVTLNHNNLKYDCLVCHNKELIKDSSVVEDGLIFNNEGELVEAPH